MENSKVGRERERERDTGLVFVLQVREEGKVMMNYVDFDRNLSFLICAVSPIPDPNLSFRNLFFSYNKHLYKKQKFELISLY